MLSVATRWELNFWKQEREFCVNEIKCLDMKKWKMQQIYLTHVTEYIKTYVP